MSPWFGKAALLVGLIVFIAIRVPHDRRSKAMTVSESRRGAIELVLLVLMTLGVLIFPLLFIFTPVFAFADYPLHVVSLAAGLALLPATFWLFHRAHTDLGTNWSVTLEIRENHQLVTHGVYRTIRHPMYAAIFMYALAQTFLLPNWIAGPSCLVAFTFMYAGRVCTEERMMQARFGEAYTEYAASTKRLIPKVW